MKNDLGNKFSSALLITVLIFALSAISTSAQSTEKPSPFGSSLKSETKEQLGQKPIEPDPRVEDIVRVNTSLVSLDILVKDATSSRYITGLTKDDFVIAEDNELQTVASLTVGDDAARLPRSIVLIFDRSQSQFAYLDASIDAAKALVNQLAPSDEMAIVTDDVELAIGFTKDKSKLKKTLDSLRKLSINGYHTRSKQFSALLATLRELIDTSRKRPIIIFQTDGDEAVRWENQGPSAYDLNTVYSEAERSRVKIYTVIPDIRMIDVPQEEIATRSELVAERRRLARAKYKDMWFGMERLPPKPNPNSNNSFELPQGFRQQFLEMATRNMIKGQTAAARVADLTGGWTSFLESEKDAGKVYGRILEDINHRYIISYYPTNKTIDGGLRKVRIEVRGHPEYVVEGRTSYYAIPR
ncbi:MAG TPA: VWA domain-containing protein [Pyrinomonadaceae bacterium]|nr:VWA domain-containing protein [Pyrinomonadaceae bacterium]